VTVDDRDPPTTGGAIAVANLHAQIDGLTARLYATPGSQHGPCGRPARCAGTCWAGWPIIPFELAEQLVRDMPTTARPCWPGRERGTFHRFAALADLDAAGACGADRPPGREGGIFPRSGVMRRPPCCRAGGAPARFHEPVCTGRPRGRPRTGRRGGGAVHPGPIPVPRCLSLPGFAGLPALLMGSACGPPRPSLVHAADVECHWRWRWLPRRGRRAPGALGAAIDRLHPRRCRATTRSTRPPRWQPTTGRLWRPSTGAGSQRPATTSCLTRRPSPITRPILGQRGGEAKEGPVCRRRGLVTDLPESATGWLASGAGASR
jgi:hypothetical protein